MWAEQPSSIWYVYRHNLCNWFHSRLVTLPPRFMQIVLSIVRHILHLPKNISNSNYAVCTYFIDCELLNRKKRTATFNHLFQPLMQAMVFGLHVAIPGWALGEIADESHTRIPSLLISFMYNWVELYQFSCICYKLKKREFNWFVTCAKETCLISRIFMWVRTYIQRKCSLNIKGT